MIRRRLTDLDLYTRLLRLAHPYWPHIAAVFLLSVLSTPLALLAPLPLKIAVDDVVGSHPLPSYLTAVLPSGIDRSAGMLLAVAAGLYLVIALLDHLQRLATSLLSTYTGQKLILGFRAQLFRHAQRLSVAYHDSKGTADADYRIQWDAGSIEWIALYGAIPFASAGFKLAGMAYVTARLDLQLAVVALGVSPAVLLVTSAARRRLRRSWNVLKDLESTAFAVVQETLTGLRLVKAFGQEDREHARFVGRSDETLRARMKLSLIESSFGLVVGLIIALGTALALFIGTRHVQAGVLSLGDLILVMGYLAQLYLPLQDISKSFTMVQASLASAERAFSLLDQVPDVVERPRARRIARATGAVAFRDVSFGYDEETVVLRGISFDVPPGTRLGIAGPTGAGKTTLVTLLMRFYDPTGGQILLDGMDLRDYNLADLRRQFGIVLQEPVLFSTSIAENIAYARPDASERDIIEAAKAANAHDFISGLPNAYGTIVGERGMRLSGGERQRVSLARAFLKDAPILILDEPTSSVDADTEMAIMQAMERLMRGRTTFMIAHRRTTLAHFEAQLELDRGRVKSMTWASGHEANLLTPSGSSQTGRLFN